MSSRSIKSKRKFIKNRIDSITIKEDLIKIGSMIKNLGYENLMTESSGSIYINIDEIIEENHINTIYDFVVKKYENKQTL